jgi:hypothetical protein
MAKKKGSIGTAIGGVLVGLDYMIMRTGKPPAEQVESAKPDRPVAAGDGGTLSIDMPELQRPRTAGDPPDGGLEP